jgi:hypothetical protein
MTNGKKPDPLTDLRMRYLGVLGLLCEASVHVPEEIRLSMEQALDDACESGRFRWRRVLDRLEIEPVQPPDNVQPWEA